MLVCKDLIQEAVLDLNISRIRLQTAIYFFYHHILQSYDKLIVKCIS